MIENEFAITLSPERDSYYSHLGVLKKSFHFFDFLVKYRSLASGKSEAEIWAESLAEDFHLSRFELFLKKLFGKVSTVGFSALLSLADRFLEEGSILVWEEILDVALGD